MESLLLLTSSPLLIPFQVKKLQAILKPMMLRRLKDDVEKNLAPKEETIIEVYLLICLSGLRRGSTGLLPL